MVLTRGTCGGKYSCLPEVLVEGSTHGSYLGYLWRGVLVALTCGTCGGEYSWCLPGVPVKENTHGAYQGYLWREVLLLTRGTCEGKYLWCLPGVLVEGSTRGAYLWYLWRGVLVALTWGTCGGECTAWKERTRKSGRATSWLKMMLVALSVSTRVEWVPSAW